MTPIPCALARWAFGVLLSLAALNPLTLPAAENPDVEPGDLAIDKQHLRTIFEAIQAYKQDHAGAVPDWLSDLVPKYLADTNTLCSPIERRSGRRNLWGNEDPRIPTSYIYEFNPRDASVHIQGSSAEPPEKPLTMREWKARQMELYGGAVPIVRCSLYDRPISITVSGEFLQGQQGWETDTNTLQLMERLGTPNPLLTSAKKILVKTLAADSDQPVAGVQVRVGMRSDWGETPPQLLTSDGQGQCRFGIGDLKIREIRLETEGEEYVRRTERWSLSSGTELPKEFTLRLVKGLVVGGVVRNAEGQPLEGVRVKVQPLSSVRSDAQGRWKVGGLPANLGVVQGEVTHPGYRSLTYNSEETAADDRLKVSLADFKARQAVLILRAVPQFQFSAREAESGQPISDFSVMLGYSEARTLRWSPGQVASQGKLTLNVDDEADGIPQVIRMNAPGFEPLTVPMDPVPKRTNEVVLSLRKGTRLTGTVLTPDGQPAVGARVSLLTEIAGATLAGTTFGPTTSQSSGTQARTDDQGRFSLAAIPEAWGLVATHADGFAEGPLPASSSGCDLKLQRWSTVTGTLPKTEDRSAESPVALVTAHAYLPTLFAQSYTGSLLLDVNRYAVQADDQGEFSIARVPPGRRLLWHPMLVDDRLPAYSATVSFTGTPIPLQPGASFNFAATGAAIQGRLAFPEDAAAADWSSSLAAVQLHDAVSSATPSRNFLLTFSEQGQFRLTGLKPGKYRLDLRLFAPPRLRGTLKREFELASGGAKTLDLGEMKLQVPRGLAAGDTATELDAQTSAGQPLKLASFRGKHVLLHFWTGWCGPRWTSLHQLRTLQKTFGQERLAVLSLNLDEDLPTAQRAAAHYGDPKTAGWTEAYAGSWMRSALPGEYSVRSLPSVALIDPEGKVVATDLYGSQLVTTVEQALKR